MDANQFNIILSRLDKIDKEIHELKTSINKDIKGNCEKMAGHVEFVERVYDTVKSPMYFVCNQINKISGNQIEDTGQRDDE